MKLLITIIAIIIVGCGFYYQINLHNMSENQSNNSLNESEAITRATEYVRHKQPDRYVLDKPKVVQQSDAWIVYFDRIIPARPSNILIKVDKNTGNTEFIPLQ